MSDHLLENLKKLREEKYLCKINLDSKLAKIHAENIKILLEDMPPSIDDGDNLTIIYNFMIRYWDGIANKLEALICILNDSTVIRSVDTTELIHGYCVIENLFNQLDKLRKLTHKQSKIDWFINLFKRKV